MTVNGSRIRISTAPTSSTTTEYRRPRSDSNTLSPKPKVVIVTSVQYMLVIHENSRPSTPMMTWNPMLKATTAMSRITSSRNSALTLPPTVGAVIADSRTPMSFTGRPEQGRPPRRRSQAPAGRSRALRHAGGEHPGEREHTEHDGDDQLWHVQGRVELQWRGERLERGGPQGEPPTVVGVGT